MTDVAANRYKNTQGRHLADIQSDPGLGIGKKSPFHVFSGRYKSLVVDGSGTGYFKTV